MTAEGFADLATARHLIECGVPIFIAKPALGPDGAWDQAGGHGGTGYLFPTGWQTMGADLAVLDQWEPGDALCLVGGHVVDVLDVDPRNGGDGSLAALRLDGGMPVSYGEQATPSGGVHHLIATLGVRKGVPAPGLDLQAGTPGGEGRGFAFVAPTRKVAKVVDPTTGEVTAGPVHQYEWTVRPDLSVLVDPESDPDTSGEALAELVSEALRPSSGWKTTTPEHAGEHGRPPQRLRAMALAALNDELDVLEKVPTGRRNTALNRGVWKVATLAALTISGRHCLDPEVIDAEFTKVARDIGLTSSETAKTIRSALTSGLGSPRVLPSDEPASEADQPATADRAAEPDTEIQRTPVMTDTATELDVGADGFRYTDVGNGDRLVALAGDGIRFVPRWRSWIVWDPNAGRWVSDEANVYVTEQAKRIPRALFQLAAERELGRSELRELLQWANRCGSMAVLTAAITAARGIPGVPIEPDDIDADRWVLNVENGTINLQTGELLAHDPQRLIMKLAPVRHEPGAQCPTWLAFLARVLPDVEVRRFVQKVIGYCLTGLTREQAVFVLTGEGANGKSTFIKAINRMLGDYATTAPKDLLLASRHEPHPTSMTTLYRARFASAVETDKGIKFAEAKLKELTGGDEISARRMRENFWTFEPTHKLLLACNHLPAISGRDEAIWRRMRVIPFGVIIPEAERDGALDDKLDAERSGILAWSLEGLRMWREEGLRSPAAVTEAVTAYRASQDWFVRFCEDVDLHIERGSSFSIDKNTVRSRYEEWAKSEGETPLGVTAFGNEMKAHGAEDGKSKSTRLWKGVWLDDASQRRSA